MVSEYSSLPEGWIWTNLGNIGIWTSGGTPSKKNPNYFGGDIPWVLTGDLNDGFIYNVPNSITQKALIDSSAKVFPKESLLVAMYGATIGKQAILKIDASTNQACAALIKTQYNSECISFIFYYLMSQKENLKKMGKGGAQPNISLTLLKDYPLPLPPLAEQKRIVEKIESLFSDLDKGEALLKQIQQQIATYRQSVLKAAVTGELTKEWREANQNRLESGEKLLERILEERHKNWRGRGKYKVPEAPDIKRLYELPAGWVWASIDQISSINPKHENVADDQNVSFIPMDKLNQYTGQITEHEIRQFGVLKKGYTHFAENDVLFAKITPCMENSKNGVARGLHNGLACGSTEFFVIRCHEVLPDYVCLKFRQDVYRNEAAQNMSGAVGQKRVPRAFLEKTSISIPPLKSKKR